MDFTADSPTTSTPIPKRHSASVMSAPVAPVSKRLCFDEPEIVEESPNVVEVNMADISVIRRGLNGMEMGDDSVISHNSFREKSPHNISTILESSMLDFHDEGLHDVNISISPQNASSSTPSPPGNFAREVL